MTPNNIINMAMIKGLDVIAVCDHNCVKQQPALEKVASRLNFKILFGIEVESIEEVHILGLFKNLEDNQRFGSWVESKKPYIKNNEAFFGEQLVFNENDEIIEKLDDLLLVSINASIEEVADKIHEHNGKVVLAHVLDKRNGIITQLGYIPKNLKFDAIEVKDELQIQKVLTLNPWIEKCLWLNDSDAHTLWDINEAMYSINLSKLGCD